MVLCYVWFWESTKERKKKKMKEIDLLMFLLCKI